MADIPLTLLVIADRPDPLRAMLAHHQAVADEIVVVDTGGGEAAAAAAGTGAEVVQRPWDDDFAAARNHGLAAATGAWVLILDTDELISPDDFDRLRQALAEPPAVRIMTTVNYFPDPRHPEWRPVAGRYPREEAGQTGCFLAQRGGLFPRWPGLAFRGRIHETILPAAAELGLPTRPLDIPVHHYGFVLSSAHNQERRDRYGRLVRLKHAEQPDDHAAILELATVLLEEGDPEAARALLEDLAVRAPVDSAVTRGRFLLGRLLRERGELPRAREVLATAVHDDPRLIFCWLEWIRALAAAGAWGEVDRIIREARSRFGTDPLLDKEELRCLIMTGRLRAAATVLERLREAYPAWQDLQRLGARLTGKG